MPKHIVRLLALIAGVLVVAIVAVKLLTVDSFYRFGHYRANSVVEIAAKEPVFQTPRYCQGCHSARHEQWSAGRHKSVICEVCHGAAQGHPANGKLPIPKDTAKLCTLCHEVMTGRPRSQPQIQVAQHSGGQQCTVCHNPHSPVIAADALKITGHTAAGKQRAAACVACHGAEGISPNDTWPNLAGQNAAYLVKILSGYKSGEQKDVAMTPVALKLNDDDIQNLAAYYAGLSCKSAPSRKVVGDAAAGKTLSKNCVACHGEDGVGTNPAWPKLAAQKPGYLANVLEQFRLGMRRDPIMGAVARGLSDTDMANLAAYYATQSCQSKK